jgi:AXL receptor tyrosine kinase
LFSGGELPYSGLSNIEASERILKGVFLPEPEICPIYALMRKCWEMDPKNRPSFDEILEKLNQSNV